MSEQDNWLDRQRRMVKCKRHSLHFDPKMASGCYLCGKEAAKRRVYKQPKFLVLLISTLAMVLILYKLLGPKQPPDANDAPLQGLEIKEPAGSTRLDPAPYRPTVQAFEQALFGTSAESSEDLSLAGSRLASAISTLQAAISRDHPESPLVTSLEELALNFPSQGFTNRNLDQARQQWLRIRKRFLETAPWLQSPPTTTTTSKVSLAEYQTLASDLVYFLEEGTSKARSVSTSKDTTDWKNFQNQWRERFKELATQRPNRPHSESPDDLLLAYQNLEQALRRAESLSGKKNFPTSTASFEAVLDEARKALDALRNVR
jgi:hypothetical protein